MIALTGGSIDDIMYSTCIYIRIDDIIVHVHVYKALNCFYCDVAGCQIFKNDI